MSELVKLGIIYNYRFKLTCSGSPGSGTSEKIPAHTPKKEIILPNGLLVKKDRNFGKAKSILVEILAAQKMNIPFLESKIVEKRESSSYLRRDQWINIMVNAANRTLKPYHYELFPYEVEVEGTKTRAYKVIKMPQKKSAPTFSPVPEFLKA